MDLSAFDLKGKVALITGGAHGIGFSIAEGMAKCGATICFNCSSEASLEKGMAAYKAAGIDAHGYAADVSDEDAVNAMVAKIKAEVGPVDILVNNAGFGVCGSFLETSGEKELSMAKVNVLAMHQLFKFAVKKMEAQGFGTVLNVASSAGLLPGGPYMAGYYATKAYVVSLTRGVAEELRQQHSPVYVCALCPGPVDTEFNDRAGVVFALHGITPELCVEEALLGMMHRKTIIVPSAFMRLCTSAQRLVPIPLLMPIVARQQKKKLG